MAMRSMAMQNAEQSPGSQRRESCCMGISTNTDEADRRLYLYYATQPIIYDEHGDGSFCSTMAHNV